MARYVRGENTRNWKAKQSCWQKLLACIEECEAQCEGDPAYRDICFKLDQVEQELDWIESSAGRRAALRAGSYNHAGQEPQKRSEGLGG